MTPVYEGPFDLLLNLILKFSHRCFIVFHKLQDHFPKIFIDCGNFLTETHQSRLVDHGFTNKILKFVQFVDLNPDGLNNLNLFHFFIHLLRNFFWNWCLRRWWRLILFFSFLKFPCFTTSIYTCTFFIHKNFIILFLYIVNCFS